MKDTQYIILDIDDIEEFNKYSFKECNVIVNKALDKYGKDVDNIFANTLIYIIKRKKYIKDNIGNEKSQEYIDTVNSYDKMINALKHQLLQFNKNTTIQLMIDTLNTFEKMDNKSLGLIDDDKLLSLASQDRRISREELGIKYPSTEDGFNILEEA